MAVLELIGRKRGECTPYSGRGATRLTFRCRVLRQFPDKPALVFRHSAAFSSLTYIDLLAVVDPYGYHHGRRIDPPENIQEAESIRLSAIIRRFNSSKCRYEREIIPSERHYGDRMNQSDCHHGNRTTPGNAMLHAKAPQANSSQFLRMGLI